MEREYIVHVQASLSQTFKVTADSEFEAENIAESLMQEKTGIEECVAVHVEEL